MISLVALAVAACRYEAPDYGDARFRCDLAHPCPSGQPCVDGLCQPPGADDAARDGASVDGMYDGIACGIGTCALDQECCVDVVSGARCQAPAESCTGISTRCDGPEDCPGGECCLSAGSGVCTAAGTCVTATACHDSGDCTGAATTCCAILMTSWRGCFQTCP